jgi:hypothetical protein
MWQVHEPISDEAGEQRRLHPRQPSRMNMTRHESGQFTSGGSTVTVQQKLKLVIWYGGVFFFCYTVGEQGARTVAEIAVGITAGLSLHEWFKA